MRTTNIYSDKHSDPVENIQSVASDVFGSTSVPLTTPSVPSSITSMAISCTSSSSSKAHASPKPNLAFPTVLSSARNVLGKSKYLKKSVSGKSNIIDNPVGSIKHNPDFLYWELLINGQYFRERGEIMKYVTYLSKYVTYQIKLQV